MPINTLFGPLPFTKTDGRWLAEPTPNYETNMYDYVVRGELNRDIYEAQHKLDIKYAPAKYIAEKTDNLKKVVIANVRSEFTKSFKYYMDTGLSQEESQKRALHDSDARYKTLIERHKLRFPYPLETILKKANVEPI